MQFVSRAARGAPQPKAAFTWVDSTRGVKIHYEGTAVPSDLARADQHHRCADRVNQIELSHLANTDEGYISIAYSAMVCPHGTVYEGRGAHHKTGANGNGTLNQNHYAVCAMLGDSGLTEPTTPMLNGLRDAIEWLQRDGGAGPEVKGHRDGYATSCPGEPLYRWVQAGAPRPGSPTPPPITPEDDMPLNDQDLEKLAAAVWNHPLPEYDANGQATGNSKAAFWYQVWGDAFHGQVLAAIKAAKLTPAELAQAAVDGVLHVEISVTTPTVKES